jgi:hypothetical protein
VLAVEVLGWIGSALLVYSVDLDYVVPRYQGSTLGEFVGATDG